jgi:hypothetical protein
LAAGPRPGGARDRLGVRTCAGQRTRCGRAEATNAGLGRRSPWTTKAPRVGTSPGTRQSTAEIRPTTPTDDSDVEFRHRPKNPSEGDNQPTTPKTASDDSDVGFKNERRLQRRSEAPTEDSDSEGDNQPKESRHDVLGPPTPSEDTPGPAREKKETDTRKKTTNVTTNEREKEKRKGQTDAQQSTEKKTRTQSFYHFLAL